MKNEKKKELYDQGRSLRKNNLKKNEVDLSQLSLNFPSITYKANKNKITYDIQPDSINHADSSLWASNINVSVNAKAVISNESITHFSTNFHSNQSNNLFLNTYTNIILNSSTPKTPYNPYAPIDTADFEINKIGDYSTNSATIDLPLFFGNSDLVKLPSKVIYAISRLSDKLVKHIHPNPDVARELCLLFASQLTSTYFVVKDKESKNTKGWKSLSSVYLIDLLNYDSTAYKRVREVLETKLPNGSIIECNHKKKIGRENFLYRFGSYYIEKKIHAYRIKTDFVKKAILKHHLGAYARASENVICRNLFNFYINLKLPTIEEIIQEAKRLIKNKYKTKKNKKLVFRNKKGDSFFENIEQISFVEDAIEIFCYLTNDNKIMIPIIGTEASGGRVVDSFNLMPSWIRNLVTIKGKRLVELDYSCLHPNIAMNLYQGTMRYLTHTDLAEYLGMDLLDVKNEHLSFFNKKLWQMQESPLFKFYKEREPWLLNNIIHEKLNNKIESKKDKHKITSKRLFAKEVEIMTEVIEKLNREGIYTMYVYDALYSQDCHKFRVQQVMNEVILEHDIFTCAKLD